MQAQRSEATFAASMPPIITRLPRLCASGNSASTSARPSPRALHAGGDIHGVLDRPAIGVEGPEIAEARIAGDGAADLGDQHRITLRAASAARRGDRRGRPPVSFQLAVVFSTASL